MDITLKNATVLNGKKDMKAQKDMTVVIKDGKILSVKKNGDELPGSKVIDLDGAYLMPGLINMHCHLASSGKAPKSEKPTDYKSLANTLMKFALVRKIYVKLEEGLAKNELYSGVTTLRSLGGLKTFDGIVRDNINAGKIPGPRIISANTAVSVPGGHFAGSLATEATSPEEAAEDVRKIAATKPDIIKIMVTGGVMDATEEGEPGALRMQPEIVKAACDEAHKLGYKVSAHVESPEGIKVALKNGVDYIEHGAKADDEILDLFKKTGAVDICTLSPAMPYALFDLAVSKCGETGKKNGKVVYDGMIDCAKKCLDAGIPVGLGTDAGCPFTTHYNMWRELQLAVKYLDISPETALYMSTLGNATIAGLGDITGSVEEGKCADLIVSKNNPLENFNALEKLEYVFASGKLYDHPKIKKMEDVDIELDKFM